LLSLFDVANMFQDSILVNIEVKMCSNDLNNSNVILKCVWNVK